MKLRQLLHWFRSIGTPNNNDLISRAIDDVLEVKARQIQAIDPETHDRWQSLKFGLERRHASRSTNKFIFQKVLRKPAISFAIACAILIAVGVIWMQRASTKIYETTRGQHSTIVLQDSTEVILNALSEISVNRMSTDRARSVSLKGEAMFHVHRNGMPFIIATDIGTVQVLGTEFNVRVRDGRMEVAVLNGSVKMSVRRDGIDSSIILGKGQIAFCSKNEFPDAPGSLPFADYPGWMKGKLMFYRSTLSFVCSELEMQFDIKIRIENPRLQSTTLTGVIDSQFAESAVKTLVQLTGTTVQYENGLYNIY